MAKKSKKKRKQQKKYHFVETKPAAQPAQTTSNLASKKFEKNSSNVKTTTKLEANASHTNSAADVMKRETKLTASIGDSIIVGLIIVWLLVEHTGLGPKVYDLIKL